MAYRSKVVEPTGQHVVVRSYLDLMAAELARSQLEADGVRATVFEATSFNPLLSAAAGGHRVMVDEADADRANSILIRTEAPAELADDEPEGTVRCPRCELAYCTFRRPPIRSGHASAISALLWIPFALGSPKRWYCDKCEHVWDDAKAGAAAMTPLLPDDPRPVFLLFRDNAGIGLFLGCLPAMVVGIALGGLPGFFAFGAIATIGFAIGSKLGRFVCSEPGCRAPLRPDAVECSRCKGTVAGRIQSAAEHFAAAADVRRELAQARARPKRLAKKAAKTR